MSYATWHWRVYNVQRRLFGVAACLAGTTFLLAPLFLRIGWMRDESPSPTPTIAHVIAGALVLSLGVYLCRKPTFRPDLGDVAFWTDHTGSAIPAQPPRGRRSWWTGDQRQVPSRRDRAA